jgi:hypothetical protein
VGVTGAGEVGVTGGGVGFWMGVVTAGMVRASDDFLEAFFVFDFLSFLPFFGFS